MNLQGKNVAGKYHENGAFFDANVIHKRRMHNRSSSGHLSPIHPLSSFLWPLWLSHDLVDCEVIFVKLMF